MTADTAAKMSRSVYSAMRTPFGQPPANPSSAGAQGAKSCNAASPPSFRIASAAASVHTSANGAASKSAPVQPSHDTRGGLSFCSSLMRTGIQATLSRCIGHAHHCIYRISSLMTHTAISYHKAPRLANPRGPLRHGSRCPDTGLTGFARAPGENRPLTGAFLKTPMRLGAENAGKSSQNNLLSECASQKTKKLHVMQKYILLISCIF